MEIILGKVGEIMFCSLCQHSHLCFATTDLGTGVVKELCTDTGELLIARSNTESSSRRNSCLRTHASTCLDFWQCWLTNCICISEQLYSSKSNTKFPSKMYFSNLPKHVSCLFTETSTCLTSWHFHHRSSSVCQQRPLGDDMTWTQHLRPTSTITGRTITPWLRFSEI